MNMGHCRFENTLLALKECEEALEENGYDLNELSPREKKAAIELLQLCKNMSEEFK